MQTVVCYYFWVLFMLRNLGTNIRYLPRSEGVRVQFGVFLGDLVVFLVYLVVPKYQISFLRVVPPFKGPWR